MVDADPYPLIDGRPELVDSLVLFLDVLGTRHLGSRADAQNHLERLYDALQAVKEREILKADPGFSRVLTFTDSLVLGERIAFPGLGPGPTSDLQMGALGGIFLEAALYQFELTCRGIFVRGGLARGLVFMADNFAFGPALGEAYELEQSGAIYPRIILGKDVTRLLRQDMWHYARPHDAPQFDQILQTDDGVGFLNYLSFLAEIDEEDAVDELDRHKTVIERALLKWRKHPKIWEKYRWLADYHNFFCDDYFPEFSDLNIVGERYLATDFKRLKKSSTRPPIEI